MTIGIRGGHLVSMPDPDDRSPKYDKVWRVKTRLPDRYGTRCRIVAPGRASGEIVIEFQDKFQTVGRLIDVAAAPAT